ncbi:MAG: hypothetical protein KGZ53_02560 [Peptococcaceae bacterium]|nr:hypothetical protein [Peptococcaceae bacterium]
MTTCILNRARQHALRGEFSQADCEVQAALNNTDEKCLPIFYELNRLSGDCQKIGLEKVMYWAAVWMLKIDNSAVSAHLRALSYCERQAAWLELTKAMDDANANVPFDHPQRAFLNRHIARIRRKLSSQVTKAAN